VEKQKSSNWGDKLIEQIETDLRQELPEMTGLSRRNLNYMRNMYLFFGEVEFVPQAVAQIPWGHIRLILDKIKDRETAEFYIRKTIENAWSRVILEHQIELNLHTRQGKLLSNFDATVDTRDISLIRESFKESYILDFLDLAENAKERDLEKALIENISHFILELGKGFAFVGKQYRLTVGGQEFFIDLLFYNYSLRRFVVIELKTTEFRPEYVGQIGFYITAVDRNIKGEEDRPTIGLIICKDQNSTVVEYALANSSQPMGVAEYRLLSELPEDVRKYLPTEEELRSL
jgi:predicted nuclease of restriction endonuclease-like (RecB) superfamily